MFYEKFRIYSSFLMGIQIFHAIMGHKGDCAFMALF